mmetsp:Transcript_24339/g.76038  ORF Transcript_24339/g.76038 Transcript_24339/m.76038 type:complete len:273 (-) Transcript_24339:32-850(-)
MQTRRQQHLAVAAVTATALLLLVLTRMQQTRATSETTTPEPTAEAIAAVASVDAFIESCKLAKKRYAYRFDKEISLVTPWLAIGGRPDESLNSWRSAEGKRVTHVVNALDRSEDPAVAAHFGGERLVGDASGGAARVLQLNLGDDGDDDRFAAILPTVIAFVRDATRDPNAVIFVHCKSGVNRAPSLAMALLISLERYSLVSAFSAVRAARPSVRPKYIKTVAVYEQQALHRSSAPALRDGPNSSEFCDLYYGLRADYSKDGERWKDEHKRR